ncbi:PAS domain S-box protein [Limnoraphis robusta Tam1]|uniref:PAS domain S-box protein n=1 Tax=Limnoraphis robusta TaxID=1118279 RepID=UPI002B1F6124|nr:PAS domain S-box protein [Limnoraphis robusta]MEA5539927.1 PAS domain S-box protein [Limnoraphis robusta Tam1]
MRFKQPCFQNNISLRWVLVVPFVLHTVGAVTLVGYLSYRSGRQAVEKLAHQLIKNVGQQVTQELDHYLQNAHEFNQRQIAAIQSGAINLQNLDQLHRYLILQHQQTEDLTTLLFGTPQGDFRVSHRVSPRDYGVTTKLQPEELPFEASFSTLSNPATLQIYSINEAGELMRPVETLQNIDVRDRPWYRQAVETGKPGWSPPFQIGSTNLLALNAYDPLYDQSRQLLGVFAVNISLNQLGDFLRNLEVGESGEVYIIERNGLLIADSMEEMPYSISGKPDLSGTAEPGTIVFQRLFPSQIPNSVIQDSYEYLLAKFENLATVQSAQALNFQKHGDRYFLNISPYQDQYGLDWLIVTVIPESDLMAEIHQNIDTTIVLCLLALGLAIASGLITANRFMFRITRVNRVSQELASGNLTQRLPADSPIAEVKALAQSFNKMADQLQQSFDRLENALEESEEKFTTIFRIIPDPIAITNLTEGRLLEVNNRMIEFYGYSREEMIGRTALEVGLWVNSEERGRFKYLLETQGYVDNLEITTPTSRGEIKIVLLSAKVCNLQGQNAVIVIIRDITEQQAALREREQVEQALRQSEERFQQLAAASPGVIYTVIEYPSGPVEYQYLSPAFEDIHEVSIAEVRQDASITFKQIHPDDREGYQQAVKESVETDKPFKHEWRIITPSGKIKWIQAHSRPQRRDNGEIAWHGVVLDISDRKQIEKQLRKTEQWLQQYSRQSPSSIYTLVQEPDGHLWFEYTSSAVETIHEVTLAQALENAYLLLEQMHPDDVAGYIAAVTRSAESLELFSYEWRIITPSGKLKWLRARAQPERRSNGAIAWHGVVEDISDYKQAEAALRQSELKFATIFRDSPQPAWIATLEEGRCLDINESFTKVLGYSRTEAIAKTCVEMQLWTDLADLQQFRASLLQEGRIDNFEIGFRTKSSEVKTVLVFARVSRLDDRDCVIGVLSDISDRKQLELALQQSEAKIKNIFNSAMAAISSIRVFKDNTWQIDQVSAGVEILSGYTSEELTQDNFLWMSCIDPDDWQLLHPQIYADIFAERSGTYEYRLRHKDGSLRWISQTNNSCWDEVGKCWNVTAISVDINARKQAQQELQEAKEAAEAANHAKSAFLATMSHELRTPLNAILGFTQLINRDATLSPDYQNYIKIIHNSGSYLLKLINEILDLSKIEAGKLSLDNQALDLFDLLQSLHATFSQRVSNQKLQVELDILPKVPQFIITDAQKLQQVLINLIGNAIKFTKTGLIILRVGLDNQDSFYSDFICLNFEVKDTGVGISPEDLNEIFEAFTQASAGRKVQEGTGLGLTISRRLVQLMGGEITVSSRLGEGSTFAFTLPVQTTTKDRVKPQNSEKQVTGLAPNQPIYRILVVDNQAENRLLLVKLLEQVGLEVKEAASAEEALLIWQQWQPHLIWMDLRMPGVDGYETTRKIRAHEQNNQELESTIIIALTAQASVSDRAKALAVGCDDYISKPIEITTLFNKMAEHLGVVYLYSQDNHLFSNDQRLVRENLTSENIAVMPHNWIVELYEASIACQHKTVEQLIKQIPPEYSSLAIGLEQLNQDFEFETMMKLTQQIISCPVEQL